MIANIYVSIYPTLASEVSDPSAIIKTGRITSSVQNEQIRLLGLYLESHNSPLVPYADLFIEKAEQYGLPDWKLVPAISGVESTFGKHIPQNSYNAWGWTNGAYSFTCWESAIDEVTKTIGQKYIARGLDTPEKMSHVYAPPSITWASKVRFFMQKISDFETPKILNLSI